VLSTTAVRDWKPQSHLPILSSLQSFLTIGTEQLCAVLVFSPPLTQLTAQRQFSEHVCHRTSNLIISLYYLEFLISFMASQWLITVPNYSCGNLHFHPVFFLYTALKPLGPKWVTNKPNQTKPNQTLNGTKTFEHFIGNPYLKLFQTVWCHCKSHRCSCNLICSQSSHRCNKCLFKTELNSKQSYPHRSFKYFTAQFKFTITIINVSLYILFMYNVSKNLGSIGLEPTLIAHVANNKI
jgi:hypothetical protein